MKSNKHFIGITHYGNSITRSVVLFPSAWWNFICRNGVIPKVCPNWPIRGQNGVLVPTYHQPAHTEQQHNKRAATPQNPGCLLFSLYCLKLKKKKKN